MEKIIEAKPKQQTYTIPKVEEQWTKSPAMTLSKELPPYSLNGT